MTKVGRNKPCPCGSGKKYKRCHEGQVDDPAMVEPKVTSEAHVPRPLPSWTRYIPHVLGVTGSAIGLYIASTGNPRGAFAVGGATGLLVAGWLLFSNPPPPRGDGADPAGLNFGRNQD